MPTSHPTGFETYVYSHQWGGYPHPQHIAENFDKTRLPKAESEDQVYPVIMVEPSYATNDDDIFLMFSGGLTKKLPRYCAEQLRDALIKVCQKPLHKQEDSNDVG